MKQSLVAVALLALTGCATPYGEAEEERSEASLTEPKPAAKPTPAPAPKKETLATGSANHDTAANADVPPAPSAAGAPAALDFSWHQVSATAEYSLDAMLTTGEMVGPCIGAPVLGRELTLEGFTGKCVSAERTFALSNIVDFRICYAENDDWAHCECKLASWDGKSPTIEFDN